MSESERATAFDVAAAIIEKRPGPDQMQLHKLLYLVQAASLAWFDEPAFTDRIEAWKYGPVVRGVIAAYQEYGNDPIKEAVDGDPSVLSERTEWIVDKIIDEYGELSGLDLAALIKRSGSPWRLVRGDLSDDANSNAEITRPIMNEYHRHHGVTWVKPSPKERRLATQAKSGDSKALDSLLEARGINAVAS